MTQRTDSVDTCTLDEGPSCTTSPVDEYAWFVKRIGRKIRDIVGSNPKHEE